MPVKIGFEVISSTGEDERFRAIELNYHGPTVRGWRSSPNGTFPQQLIIKLKVLAILHQIQILAHQYLIPQKVEICTSSLMEIDNPIDGFISNFEYLGFITFSDNKNTGYRSRELKSIFIPAKKAKFIKIVIHSNHPNAKNVHNQVALVAINVLGDPLQNFPETNNNTVPNSPLPSINPTNPSYFSPYDDLAFEMYVDEEIAKIIKLLECKKLRAVQEEEFDYANVLKTVLENLRAAGEILGLYEQEKRQAIIKEDYDKAKKKKLQMDNFRKKIYSALNVQQLLESNQIPRHFEMVNTEEDQAGFLYEDRSVNQKYPNFQSPPSDTNGNARIPRSKRSIQNRYPEQLFHSKSQNFMPEDQYGSASYNATYISSSTSYPQMRHYLKDISENQFSNQEDGIESTQSSYTRSEISSDNESSLYKSLDAYKCSSKFSESRSLYTFSREPNLRESFRRSDSVSPKLLKSTLSKAKTDGNKNGELADSLTKSSFEQYEERTLPALRSYHGNEVVKSCQLTLDPPRKSTLNEREKKQATLPISVFGIELIEKFYSKSFSDKEEGLKDLQQELKTLSTTTYDADNKPPAFNKIARAATFLLHRALRDKVFSVYSCAAETVRLFFVEYVPQRVSPPEVARSVEKLFPELLAKSGDVTPRIHNMAAHTLLTMAECEEVRKLNIIPVHLSRPLTTSVHPRLALSRLEMVEQLILSQGISKEKKSGLSCRTLAEFGSSGLDHPAEPVRKVSERILIEVYKVNPRIVRKQLPPDDNVTRRNLLYRNLFQQFDQLDTKRKLNESACDNVINMADSADTQIAKEKKIIPIENGFKIRDKSISFVNAEKKDLSQKTINKSPSTMNFKRLPESIKVNERERLMNLHITKNQLKRPILKFPSLTDSIDTTKARLLFNGKTNNNIQTPDQTSIPPVVRRSEGKNFISNIPIPTFKGKNIQSQKILSELVNRHKDSVHKSKLPKKIVKENYNHHLPKLPMGDKKKTIKMSISDEKMSSPDNNDEGIVMEETAKLSDSMMTSIREMESSLGYTTDDQEQGQTHFKSCIFCLSPKVWTNEEGLTNHYLKECLMLTTCKYCKEVTEISAFTNHLLGDCKKKNLFLKCNECYEAILKDSLDKHKCIGEKPGIKNTKSRCPFCHSNIGDEDTCWRKHLVDSLACSNHPRKLIK